MTGDPFSALYTGARRRNAGFFVGILAFLVSALVFFTEASFTAEPISGITVKLTVTMFCCFLMYTSMSDAGSRAGEEVEVFRAAEAEWMAAAARVRSEGRLAGLPAFCRSLALEERENARADLLAAAGLPPEFGTGSEPERMSRGERRLLRRIRRLRLLRLTPGTLMDGGMHRRRSLLPHTAGEIRAAATARTMIWALLGSCITVSVALSCRDGLTAASVISAVFRLLTLLWTGVRGYTMGYRATTVSAVRNLLARAGYLSRYLGKAEA